MCAAARLVLSACLVCLCLFPCASVRASFDEFSDEQRPAHFELRAKDDRLALAIKGELKLGLHDIEGKGGPGYDSPTDTLTLGTRSPHIELDSFWLALRLGFSKHLNVNTLLEFTTSRASLSSVWLDFRAEAPARLFHRVELGYQTPIVAIDRRSERYALAATSHWKNPEFHLAYEGALFFTSDIHLELGLSIAMMRPLIFSGVQQSNFQGGTINVLGAGPAKSFSGNGPVLGGRLKFDAHGAFIEAFGFVGELAAQSGTDMLRSGFPNYRALPGYSTTSASRGDFHWFGGRLGFKGDRLLAFAELIVSREDLLDRVGAYAQLSHAFGLPFFGEWLCSVEPLVRVETMRILGSTDVRSGIALRSPAMITAVSWDWNALTVAIALEVFDDLVWLRAEYYVLREKNGVSDLGLDESPFANDELLIQLSLRF
ncbi:MAG: hypothetical protein LBM75_00865 [Myxococcales bacterium]|jgi:hypothetical protein|nr:hypothetical protein [Myxococcales bacterium]